MQHFKELRKAAAVLLAAMLTGFWGTAAYYSGVLPDDLTAVSGRELRIAEYPELSFSGSGSETTVSLFGAIPVKSVSVTEAEERVVAAGGTPFGIKLLMEGVMVTGLGDVDCGGGKLCCPAKTAGVEKGDIICLANGESLTSNRRLQEIISASEGQSIDLTVRRGDCRFTTVLEPVRSESSGRWRGGMWVRDSIAGIGTISFIDISTGEFAALGHPICDADTGELVPVHSGEAVPVEITSAKRGEKGIPGELRGCFMRGSAFGTLYKNDTCGIFGRLSEETLNTIPDDCPCFELGYRQDIHTGSAEILSTVSGCEPEVYSIEIESIDLSSTDSKSMVIKITDDRLIGETGGIIQGMSGSPVIQDGRLIGAVTHVFISDPERGYAVFAENMLSQMSG